MEFHSKRNELIWNNLNLKISHSNKVLLSDISGSVGPSSMTAMMGPSGAGKTTLLNALAGRLPKELHLTGEIKLNDHIRNDKDWPKIMGYVEQDFYGYEYQTVYETLKFSNTVKGSGQDKEINDIMNILGLTNVRDNQINNLSGGERKRLSIGVELLGNPPILFLDEPTSGLDSYNAINILELLKKLTEYGKTILVTIHQPSYQQISYFSKIILLSQGGMIYEGDLDNCINFFESCGYTLPAKTNPTDYFLDTISLDTSDEEKMHACTQKINKIKEKWREVRSQKEANLQDEILPSEESKGNSVFISLLKRNLVDYFRKKTYLGIKVAQKIIFLLIFGLAYLRMGYSTFDVPSRKGSFTFLVLNNLFGVCAPIFNVFPEEKRVIIRERRSGMYNGYTAFLAKYISEIPFNLFYEITYVTALYWIIGLNPNAGKFFICLLIITSLILFSIAFGLTISTISPAQNIAQIIGSTFILLFTVYSGAFGSTSTIPSWLRWMIYLSPAYYAYTAILQNQFEGETFYSDKTGQSIPGEHFIYENDSEILGKWWCIFLIWLYTLAWLIVGAIALQFVTRSNINLEKKEEVEDL